MFVLGEPFQPTLIFADEAGASPNRAPFRDSPLRQALGLISKY